MKTITREALVDVNLRCERCGNVGCCNDGSAWTFAASVHAAGEGINWERQEAIRDQFKRVCLDCADLAAREIRLERGRRDTSGVFYCATDGCAELSGRLGRAYAGHWCLGCKADRETARAAAKVERERQRELELEARRAVDAAYRAVREVRPCVECGGTREGSGYYQDRCPKCLDEHRRDVRHRGAATRRARLVNAEHADYKRSEIMTRWSGLCCYCDSLATDIDHVNPISRGGADAPHNLVPACAGCNRGVGGKHAKTLAEWAATF